MSQENGSVIDVPEDQEEDSQLDTSGQTEKAPMGLVGLTMSSVVRWLTEERLYAISGVAILVSGIALFSVLSFLMGSKYIKQKQNVVYYDGKEFLIQGMGLVPGQSDLMIPIYREVIK